MWPDGLLYPTNSPKPKEIAFTVLTREKQHKWAFQCNDIWNFLLHKLFRQ